jgi:hypothetical protein
MILIDTAIEAENLVISAPGADSITVPLEPEYRPTIIPFRISILIPVLNSSLNYG